MSRLTDKPVFRRVVDRNRVYLPSRWLADWHVETGDYVQIALSQAGDELIVRPVKA
jgi:hypothetical protein